MLYICINIQADDDVYGKLKCVAEGFVQ